ncbi:MAG: ASKHA domain-containing protein, partial [Pseudoflavonifractor sp.]
EEGNLLLVDIGTNGEMALKTGDKLLCCSTAAGPAFEGAGISCGSGATVGAISKVTVAENALAWEAIGGGPGLSLCGSGLIDAVAACLALGYFTPAGRVQKQLGGSIPFPGSSVTLTQKDIRQVQLAKGAIRAGIDTMLHHCDLTYEALDRVILCGGFGSYLSPGSAEAIGMLPPGAADKVQVIGNAAGSGAAALLLDRSAAAEAEEIARKALCIELSADKYFMQQFIAQLNF